MKDAEMTKEEVMKELEGLQQRLGDVEISVKQQRKMYEELFNKDAMFMGLFEFAPDAIVIVNSEGIILNANTQAENIFGYEKNELLNKPVDILIPPRFRKSHTEHMRSYIAKPHIRLMGSELELYGLRKDGTEFPVDIALGYLETKEGIIVLSIVRDITEHMKMEEALRVSEAKYRGIFENAAECIFQTSVEGRILAANPACVRVLGYSSAEEMLAAVPDVRKLYAEPGRRLQMLRIIRAEGTVSNYDAQVFRKDGSKIWVLINAHAIRDSTGKVLSLVGMMMDITGRKRAERNFQILMEGTPDAIIAIDRDFQILHVNQNTEKMFGYTSLELIEKSYELLIPERFQKNHFKNCADYFTNPGKRIMALHSGAFAKRKDKSEFPVEINMSPVETDEGIVVVIDIRDISEKKNIK